MKGEIIKRNNIIIEFNLFILGSIRPTVEFVTGELEGVRWTLLSNDVIPSIRCFCILPFFFFCCVVVGVDDLCRVNRFILDSSILTTKSSKEKR